MVTSPLINISSIIEPERNSFYSIISFLVSCFLVSLNFFASWVIWNSICCFQLVGEICCIPFIDFNMLFSICCFQLFVFTLWVSIYCFQGSCDCLTIKSEWNEPEHRLKNHRNLIRFYIFFSENSQIHFFKIFLIF